MSRSNNNFTYKDGVSLKEYFDSRFTDAEKALDLQNKEVARRLEFLNGEAERLRQMQATYLPREVYDANCKEILGKLSSLEEFKNQAIGRQAVIAVLVSAAISIAIMLVSHNI